MNASTAFEHHKEQLADALYISNHRDIILDSAFLDVLLVDAINNTVEIAIGDNLLIRPWMTTFSSAPG